MKKSDRAKIYEQAQKADVRGARLFSNVCTREDLPTIRQGLGRYGWRVRVLNRAERPLVHFDAIKAV